MTEENDRSPGDGARVPVEAALAGAPGAGPWLRAHRWCSLALCFGMTLPTTPMDLSLIPLGAVCVVGFQHTLRSWAGLWREPVFLWAAGFAAWILLGLLWTGEPGQGLDEAGKLRWLLPIVLLRASVGRHRAALVVAVLAGFAVGHVVQLVDLWGLRLGGPAWAARSSSPVRITGWWDAAVSGTTLTAATGLALAGVLFARGRGRVIGGASLGAARVGLLLTGSRGGWIGSALLLGVVGAWRLATVPRRWRGRAFAGAGVMTVALAGAVGLAWPVVEPRVSNAADEITRAVRDGDYATATGARILMKELALDVWLDRPLLGAGTGAYDAAASEAGRERGLGEDVIVDHVHAHAHDAGMHLLASNGLEGLGLGAGLLGAGLWTCWGERRRRAGFGHGPGLALIGLVLVTPFDVLHVSAHAASITGVVLGLAQRGLGSVPGPGGEKKARAGCTRSERGADTF